MQPTKVRRWTKGPHDRLYVSTNPSGTARSIDIGWFDLRTRRQQLLIPTMMAEFDAAISWWLHLPKGQPAAAPQAVGHDLAATLAGATLRQRAEQLQPRLPARVFARITGRRTPDQSWTIGERGEKAVAAKLDKLTRRGWKVLHSIQTGAGDIDHLLIGPTGVYVINTKTHPGGIVDVRPDTITVNGHRRAYAAQVTREAGLARAALHSALGRPVYVGPMLVIHKHETITGWRNHKPTGVHVLPSWAIRWWAMLPGHSIHTAADIDTIYAAAADSSTWRAGTARTPTAVAASARPSPATTGTAAQPSAVGESDRTRDVSSVAPQWSVCGPRINGQPRGPLYEFPAGPTDPRTAQWRERILGGDLGDLLSARQVATELGLPFDEFRQLVIDSEFYWYRQRTGRPAMPPPSAPDYHGEPEWFRYRLAEHFGAPPVPRHLIRNIYADLD
jgi:hypothetical protein